MVEVRLCILNEYVQHLLAPVQHVLATIKRHKILPWGRGSSQDGFTMRLFIGLLDVSNFTALATAPSEEKELLSRMVKRGRVV